MDRIPLYRPYLIQRCDTDILDKQPRLKSLLSAAALFRDISIEYACEMRQWFKDGQTVMFVNRCNT